MLVMSDGLMDFGYEKTQVLYDSPSKCGPKKLVRAESAFAPCSTKPLLFSSGHKSSQWDGEGCFRI